jgi:DNA-binding LacI/PurR family transcriptional regulator
MTKVTLQTIADAVGVSRMTVSNAFSRPDQLSPALRERILAVADDLDYCGPDPAARGLSRGRIGTVGVLFTDTLSYAFTDAVAMAFLAGAAEVLEAEGTGLTVMSVPRTGADGPGAVAQAVVDGLIVYSVDADSPGLTAARRRGFPLVLADQQPEPGVPSVTVDDRGGARVAAEHVVSLGHRDVAVVVEAMGAGLELVNPTHRSQHYVVNERLAGWRAGLAPTGKKPLTVNAIVNQREQGRLAGLLLLDSRPRPTAVLALTDVLALGVIDAAGELGLRVPDDVSVVGFDDAPVAELATPRLTTVRQPLAEKGRVAARLLVERLKHPDRPVSPAVRLPTQLVTRNSTGPRKTTRPEEAGTFSRRRR